VGLITGSGYVSLGGESAESVIVGRDVSSETSGTVCSVSVAFASIMEDVGVTPSGSLRLQAGSRNVNINPITINMRIALLFILISFYPNHRQIIPVSP
jgi:hypothetical protein